MKRLLTFLILASVAGFLLSATGISAKLSRTLFEREPDLPPILAADGEEADEDGNGVDKETYMELRAQAVAERRGLADPKGDEPRLRELAVAALEKAASDVRRRPNSPERSALLAAWTPIGPAPLAAGSARYSGRTTAIAVHPTNPGIAYVGTAQGGLYRTTDGGASWTPLMDAAQSLAIGAVAIAPSDPETVYVGTGEPNFSADSYFGVGVYRITNASTTATLAGPFNKDQSNADVFTGRAVAEIVVHPTDANTIFVATASGVGGIGGVASASLPARGVYRSTNAAGASPSFARIDSLAPTVNASIRDIAIDPSNPNILLAAVVAPAAQSLTPGGIYRSANALAASPTFTQTLAYTGTSTGDVTTELAAIHPAASANATFYAASGSLNGRVLRSTDGGVTWTQQSNTNFCSPQCFYDIAIAVDPTNAAKIFVGGSPNAVAAFSTNSGISLTDGGAGVHADTHAISVAPSNNQIVYLGTDGGIYKSTNGGASYSHLNTAQFFATQFMSIAVHPVDPNFTIGGTQDNGTNFLDASGQTWTRADGGDGGYAVIDSNATDNTNVRMYHTYFNQTNNAVGYATRATTTGAWTFRGCQGTSSANGISCGDTVQFYAPLEQGPGTPNTIYYGTDRLYRSADAGATHTVVSQAPIAAGVAISAIGISPQVDGVRVVGLRDGKLFGTSTGIATLLDLDPSNQIPNAYISRVVIDPTNAATAYVTLSAFGVGSVYKTNNLGASPPTWTAVAGTLPQVPVNAFVVDPMNPGTLYAGTDIGVYASSNGGTTWAPLGTGLPRVAVFDMALTNPNAATRWLRIATHGKGMYQISLTPARVPKYLDFDGDSKTDVAVYRASTGEWWINRSTNLSTTTAQFGAPSDIPAPADYTGDGKADVAFFRPADGSWYVLRSDDATFYSFPFGSGPDAPVPGDYDGDGMADAAVFRASIGMWFVMQSGGGTSFVPFGAAGDRPVPGDYDGDGKTDYAIFRPATGEWWIRKSSNAAVVAATFGSASDICVPGDYTGDGKTDVAVFRPSDGSWYILRSEDASFYSFPFGSGADLPAPGDYDGDGTFDAAVFRPSIATWFVARTTAGTMIQAFGAGTDTPLPNYFVR